MNTHQKKSPVVADVTVSSSGCELFLLASWFPVDLARKKWEFSWEMAGEVSGQRQAMVALMASARCLHPGKPELSGCFAAVEFQTPVVGAAATSSPLYRQREQVSELRLTAGPRPDGR